MDRKHHLTDNEAIEIFSSQLEDDLEEVIDQGFNKLDITNDGTIPLRTIKQALMLNSKTHIDHSSQKITKQL